MKILFALIFVAYHGGGYMGSGNSSAVRIGAYEKLAQCKDQGARLVTAMKGQEVRDAYFFCVPVNR